MFEQQSFEGFEAGGRVRRAARQPQAPAFGEQEHGFFLAVRPDAGAQALLMRLAAQERGVHRLKGSPRPAGLLHATLFSLGRYEAPDEDADRILDAVKLICGAVAQSPFEVGFDRVLSFKGGPGKKNPVVAAGGAGTDALVAFRETLRLALANAGLAFSDSYTPHVTLLYDHAEVEAHAVAPIAWTVASFVLIHSDIGRSRHTVLAQWALERRSS